MIVKPDTKKKGKRKKKDPLFSKSQNYPGEKGEERIPFQKGPLFY